MSAVTTRALDLLWDSPLELRELKRARETNDKPDVQQLGEQQQPKKRKKKKTGKDEDKQPDQQPCNPEQLARLRAAHGILLQPLFSSNLTDISNVYLLFLMRRGSSTRYSKGARHS